MPRVDFNAPRSGNEDELFKEMAEALNTVINGEKDRIFCAPKDSSAPADNTTDRWQLGNKNNYSLMRGLHPKAWSLYGRRHDDKERLTKVLQSLTIVIEIVE